MAKGIVKDIPTASGEGKVLVIYAESNNFRVAKGSKLSVVHDSSLDLEMYDVIEFSIDGPDSCRPTRKLTTHRGTVTVPSFDTRGGEVELIDADPGLSGKKAGDKIRFNFYPESSMVQTNVNDSVQVIIESDSISTYVKTL